MSKLLQVAQLGHPILRKKASKISDISNKELQDLIDDLIATVSDIDGVGIAAPQAYVSKQLFVLASKPSKRYPNAPLMKPMAFINPKILKHSNDLVKDWEGCLSLPGIRALVLQFSSIKVEFTNKDGKKTTREFNDFIARIFQYEYDHLQGLVYLDNIESTKDIITEKEYQKIVAKKTTKETK